MRIADLFTVTSQHGGKLIEGHVTQFVADLATFPAIFGELAEADLVPGRVVADDADKRQIEAYHCLKVPAGQRERAVTKEAHYLFMRLR